MKNIKRRLKLYVFLILISNALICNAQKTSKLIRFPDGNKVGALALTSYIQEAMDSLYYPGLSIAIVNKNEIVYHRTLGVVNIKTKEEVTPKTIFEGASLSKPLFAYFLMKMVEQGKLSLDEPIFPYLEPIFSADVIAPSSLAAYKTLTPRIILSHGTGIPNWVKGEPIDIAFEPGTDFSYSGEAYQHLGAAFGLKQGIGWGGRLDTLFIKEAALPIGMDRSFYTWNNLFENDLARGHIDGKVNPEENHFKKVGPGFSLHSNAEDYALFLNKGRDVKRT